jgi:hypothetical protein
VDAPPPTCVTTAPRIRLSPTVARFWRFMLAYGCALVIVSVVHGVLFGPRAGAVALLVMLLVWWGTLSFGQAWFVPYWVAAWGVETVQLGPQAHRPWSADNGSAYNWIELDRQTQALQAQGFVKLQDYQRLRPDGSLRPGQWQSFARCFTHPEWRSYAEIGFRLMPIVPSAVDSEPAVVDVLYGVCCSCFECDWLLIDSNLAPHRRESLLYAWRHPREVRHYYPQLPVANLVDRHQANRATLIQQRELQPRPPAALDQAWDVYCTLQRELIQRPWQRLRQRNLLVAMFEATQFERHPRDRWLPR